MFGLSIVLVIPYHSQAETCKGVPAGGTLLCAGHPAEQKRQSGHVDSRRAPPAVSCRHHPHSQWHLDEPQQGYHCFVVELYVHSVLQGGFELAGRASSCRPLQARGAGASAAWQSAAHALPAGTGVNGGCHDSGGQHAAAAMPSIPDYGCRSVPAHQQMRNQGRPHTAGGCRLFVFIVGWVAWC